MDPTRWLEETQYGFDLLSKHEREAIKDFALLWSLYEGMVLDTEGSTANIIRSIGQLKERDKLTLMPFRNAIQHFSARYFNAGCFTPEFTALNLRAGDNIPLIKKVLCGKSLDEGETLIAILVIVRRLRNNLFHGVKWIDGIQGQLGNFRNANAVLMSVMTLHFSRAND